MKTDAPVREPGPSSFVKVRRVPVAEKEQWYGAANLVSLSRIPMALSLWFVGDDGVLFGIIVVAAALSDGLDGFVARLTKRNLLLEPDRGMGVWLDPLCDKIFVVSAVAAASFAFSFPLWIVGLILSREILLAFSAILRRRLPDWRRTRGVRLRAVFIGKATTAAQFVAILALALGHASAVPLAVASGILGTLAALRYVRLAFRTPAPER